MHIICFSSFSQALSICFGPDVIMEDMLNLIGALYLRFRIESLVKEHESLELQISNHMKGVLRSVQKPWSSAGHVSSASSSP